MDTFDKIIIRLTAVLMYLMVSILAWNGSFKVALFLFFFFTFYLGYLVWYFKSPDDA